MKRSEQMPTSTADTTPESRTSDTPAQDGSVKPRLSSETKQTTLPDKPEKPRINGDQHSGILERPLNCIARTSDTQATPQTDLEAFKQSIRRYAPVQRGLDALPWEGQWYHAPSDQVLTGRLIHDPAADAIVLEYDTPQGPVRERHHDLLFTTSAYQPAHPRQPRETYSGSPIRPIQSALPRTVETLCPECAALILGRYFTARGAVWIEKTCPDHGYYRDKVNSDVELFRRATRAGYQDERGVFKPQVTGAAHCPSDCGLCNQHHSTSCLAQIDLTNRCNLTCPVCFASANNAGYVAEPEYDLVVEMLQSLRDQEPYPATAIQFTGGEPTLHPDFLRIIAQANRMGFSHVQIATNGIRLADPEFAERAAEAGLHTLYLQFDGTDDDLYRKIRGATLLEKKLKVVENCRRTGMKICLVPTIVRGVNDDQVAKIFQFAVENIDAISAISYQPVAFTGRISHHELEQQRYTLGDLAHDLAAVSGADLERDFFPLNFIPPLARILQTIDGKPKIRPSCHSDCAFGTYFFITPDGQAVPMPKIFNIKRLFDGLNDLAARIEATRSDGRANWRDKLALVSTFLRSYRWTRPDRRITPFTFIHALRGLTDKSVGRGDSGHKTFRTLMAAGMHFMDRYNYDTERIRRCVIQYSTPDGIYPFCTINGGPTYRPFIEAMIAKQK